MLALIMQIDGENYKIIREKIPTNEVLVEVRTPKGQTLKVFRYNRRKPLFFGIIPAYFKLRSPGYYRFVVGNTYDVKIYVKRGYKNIIYFGRDEMRTYERKFIRGRDFTMFMEPYDRMYVKITSPRGVHVRIKYGFSNVHEDIIPTSFHPHKEGFYTVELISGNFVFWERKFEFNRNSKITLMIHLPSPIDDEDFEELLEEVKEEESFEEVLEVLSEYAEDNYFTSEHVLKILNNFEDDRKKLEVAKVLYSKLIDKHNVSRIYDEFEDENVKYEFEEWVEEYENGGWIEGWD